MRTSERHFALREAHHITDADAYFGARPALDTPDLRAVFEAGYSRGFDAAEKVYTVPVAQAAPTSILDTMLAAYDANPELRQRLDRGRLVGVLTALLQPSGTAVFQSSAEGDAPDHQELTGERIAKARRNREEAGLPAGFHDGARFAERFHGLPTSSAPEVSEPNVQPKGTLPWPCTCDERGIGAPGVSCGDCPRDYIRQAPAPARGNRLADALEYLIDAWVMGNGSEWNQSDSAKQAREALAEFRSQAPAVKADESLLARLGFFVQAIAYAEIHGWPRESQTKLVAMADALLKAQRQKAGAESDVPVQGSGNG